MTAFKIWVDELTCTYNFAGQLTYEALQDLQLTEFDKLVINDCMQEDRTIADRLLALELIFRKLEENGNQSREV